jgi:hypothetical protein
MRKKFFNPQVYGLNFSSKDDAEIFAAAMLRALEVSHRHKRINTQTAHWPGLPALFLLSSYVASHCLVVAL